MTTQVLNAVAQDAPRAVRNSRSAKIPLLAAAIMKCHQRTCIAKGPRASTGDISSHDRICERGNVPLQRLERLYKGGAFTRFAAFGRDVRNGRAGRRCRKALVDTLCGLRCYFRRGGVSGSAVKSSRRCGLLAVSGRSISVSWPLTSLGLSRQSLWLASRQS